MHRRRFNGTLVSVRLCEELFNYETLELHTLQNVFTHICVLVLNEFTADIE